MVDITIVNGAYKPTYNWGAPHCIDITVVGWLYKTNLNITEGPKGPHLIAFAPGACAMHQVDTKGLRYGSLMIMADQARQFISFLGLL